MLLFIWASTGFVTLLLVAAVLANERVLTLFPSTPAEKLRRAPAAQAPGEDKHATRWDLLLQEIHFINL